MKLKRVERLALWLLFTWCFCGCASHLESKIAATLARTTDTTEPVAVPQRLTFEGWSWNRPLVPNAGGPLTPPTATPLPDGTFYFKGVLEYGPPGEKTTHGYEGAEVTTDLTSDKKPEIPSLLGLLLGHWPYALLGVVAIALVALVGFRKSDLVQRIANFLPFPFSLLRLT